MTTVVGDDLKRLDLCEDCARKAGAIHPSGFLAEEVLLQDFPKASETKLHCSECGYPLDSLQKTGRLGCATCYERFSDSLAEALVETQKGLVHRGKRPMRRLADPKVWEADLKQLIAIEDFEGAARLRDQIAAKKVSISRRTKK
jgi:protein arginine kinase activator